jgi:hypothetical protein
MNGKKGNGARASRAQKAKLGARRADLVSSAKGELQEAGLYSLGYFETMIDPSDIPPARVPDSHSAMSAVFKTPFIVDLPFSGVWNPQTARTDPLGPENTDGYSEVIVVPGTTDCIYHTLGTRATPWTNVQAATPLADEMLLIPTLDSHPIGIDVIAGRVQLVQGLKTFNVPGANEIACLPKRDSQGHSVFELSLIPVQNVSPNGVEFLVAFYNPAVDIVVTTIGHLVVTWDSGPVVDIDLPVSSTGDNNTIHSGYFLFQTTLPVDNDFVVSFYVEVEDDDPSSHWTFALRTPVVDGWGVEFPARSATAFVLIDAPEMGDLAATDAERTTALTALVTYMGSDLENGGQISAARLAMAYSPLRSIGGDVYGTLAAYPFYNDNFPLKDGIYVWWLPDSIQEYFYTPYRRARSDFLATNSVLQVACLRDNANQALRLEIIQNLEVLTRSRLYASKSGPINPAYSAVIGVVKRVPAVTINQRHKSILGKAFSAAKGWLTNPTNFRKLIKVGGSILPRLFGG